MAYVIPRRCQLCGRMADPYDGGYYFCAPQQDGHYADDALFWHPLPQLVICPSCMSRMIDLYIADMKNKTAGKRLE